MKSIVFCSTVASIPLSDSNVTEWVKFVTRDVSHVCTEASFKSNSFSVFENIVGCENVNTALAAVSLILFTTLTRLVRNSIASISSLE